MKKHPYKKVRKKMPMPLFLAIILVCATAIGMLIYATSRTGTAPDAALGTAEEYPEQKVGTTEGDIQRGQETLKRLVQSHPDPLIAKSMDSLVRAGVLFCNYQNLEPLAGAGSATFLLVNTSDYGLVPTMSINLTELCNPEVPDQLKQLIILHEFIHYLQYAKRTVRVETFYTMSESYRMTKPEVIELFEAESQAYCYESQFAATVGWQDFFYLCRAYANGGLIGMRRELAGRYSEMEQFRDFRRDLFRIAADTTHLLPPLL